MLTFYFDHRWRLFCTVWKCVSYSEGWMGIYSECWRCSFGRGTRDLLSYGCFYLSSFSWDKFTIFFGFGIFLQFKSEVLDWDCSAFFDHLLHANLRPLNAKVMVCIFWRLIARLMSTEPSRNLLVSIAFCIC